MKTFSAIAALAAAMALAPAAHAAAWSASGPGAVTVVSDGTTSDAQMTYSLSGPEVWNTQTWQFATTASSAGPVTLNYDYLGFHAYYYVQAFVDAFVTHNGVTSVVQLQHLGPANCCSSPSAGFHVTSSATFAVQPGDTYGFRFGGSNFDSTWVLEGTFTVKNPDSDGDGIPDSLDQCPHSDYSLGKVIDSSGCTVADYCPCQGWFSNHGGYVSCVAHNSKTFKSEGLISNKDKGVMQSTAAQMTCGG